MMNFQLPAYTPTARQRQNRNRTESEMSAVIMFNSTATNLPPIIRRVNEGKSSIFYNMFEFFFNNQLQVLLSVELVLKSYLHTDNLITFIRSSTRVKFESWLLFCAVRQSAIIECDSLIVM